MTVCSSSSSRTRRLHQTGTPSWPYSHRYSKSARRSNRFIIGTVATVAAAVVAEEVVEAMPMGAEAVATNSGTVTAGTPIGSHSPGSYGTRKLLMTLLRKSPLMKLTTGTAHTRSGASIQPQGATSGTTIAIAMAMEPTVAVATVVGMAGQSEPLRPLLITVADSSPQ